MKKSEVHSIFKAFEKLRVLVIGDVMLDSYLFGKVNRISPEAPVPVVAVTRKENRLGGSANVALNLQSLGATPLLCSVIGEDAAGAEFLELVKKEKLLATGMIRSRNRTTTVKTRVIGNNHQMLRVDEERTEDITDREAQLLYRKIEDLLLREKPQAIVFEDYDKGCLTPSLISKVITLATRKGIPVAVDPKKKNFLQYKGCTLFKPNLKELREGLKLDLEQAGQKELDKAAARLSSLLNCKQVLVTLSEKGVLMFSGKKSILVPAHVRSIADVSGAGDTVISVASLCMALQLEPSLIAAFSNIAGGLVCEKVGVVSIDKEQFQAEAVSLLAKA